MSSAIYDAFLGSLNLRQVSSSSFNPGATISVQRVSGGQLPSFITAGAASPRASFSSMDLFGALTAIDLSAGLHISAGTIVIPFQQRAQGSTFTGAGANQTITAANALAVITGVEAAQSGDGASVSIDVIFRSTDGVTNPVTLNVGATPSAQAFVGSYGMGPVTARMGAESAIAQIAQVTRFSVSPGLGVAVMSYDGGNYPTLITIDTQDPTIDLTFEDFTAASRFLSDFTSLTSITVFLRKKVDGGSFVNDATASHISFTLTGGMVTLQSITAGATGNGSVTLKFTGKSIAKSLAAAIVLNDA